MSDFTNRLDFLLIKNKMKRVDLVRISGVNESTIRGWYKQSSPNSDALLKIANAFNVTTDWLLTGKGEEELEREKKELATKEPIVTLNFQEKKLLETFKKLNERDRNNLLKIAKIFDKTSENECSQ